jgi:outer membrane protein assembly factor BamB
MQPFRRSAGRVALSATIAACLLVGPGAHLSAARGGAGVTVNWPQFRLTPDHTGYNASESVLTPNTVGKVGLQWSYKTKGSIMGSASVANGVAYAGSTDNSIYALNTITGTLLWKVVTGGDVGSTPDVVNGVVYVGSDDGNLYALDAAAGSLKWSTPLGGCVQSSPNVVAGVIYVGSCDTHLYALDAATGATLWSTKAGAPIHSSPAVVNGTVYFGSDDHKIYAISSTTGSVVWTVTTGDFVQSSPAVSGGVVFVGSHDGKLYALDAATGATVWIATTPGIGSTRIQASPAIAYGNVYVSVAEYAPIQEGFLYSFNAATGAFQWSQEMADQSVVGPVVANSLVYTGSTAFGLNAYDATTGYEWMHYGAGSGITGSPTVVNGMIYLGVVSGLLSALSDTSGPTMTFDAEPADPSNASTTTFVFHANEPINGATTCVLDAGAPADCSSGTFRAVNLTNGAHTLTITATDVAGNLGTTSFTWTVNTTAPVLTVNGGYASGYTNKDSVQFYLSSSETPSTYACSLDGVSILPCIPPFLYVGLSDGTHTFTATATDTAGNVSAPVSKTWIQDRTSPVITVTGGPAPGSLSNSKSATFTLSSNEPLSTFKCSKDLKTFSNCASPFTWSWMSDGAHTLQAYAIDPAGNISSTWSVTWTVDATKPIVTITSGPPSTTSSTDATFLFTASDANAVTFTCQMDAGTPTSCVSPKTYSGLAIGSHTFTLTGTDAAGNATTKMWKWSIKAIWH